MGLTQASFAGLSTDQGINVIADYLDRKSLSLYDAFRFVDRDHNGWVSWEEFYMAVQQCVAAESGRLPDTNALYAIFQRFDVNHDTWMSLDEFAASLSRAKQTERLAKSVLERVASSLARTKHTPDELFDRLDRDRSGTLSRLELEEVILSLQPDLTLAERDAIWHNLDKDGSGSIDLNEFRARLNGVNAAPLVALEEKLDSLQKTFSHNGYGTYESFAAFDQDKDNQLSVEEWRQAMLSVAPQMSQADVDAIFGRFDTNDDGYLSLVEFSNFYQDTIDRRPQLQQTADGWPQYVSPPQEVPWETEILNMVRDCLSPGRSGLPCTEVFRRLDVDGSGHMTAYEFYRLITTYRPDLGQEHLDSLMSKVNISGSGSISLSEFVRRFG